MMWQQLPAGAAAACKESGLRRRRPRSVRWQQPPAGAAHACKEVMLAGGCARKEAARTCEVHRRPCQQVA